MKIYTGRLKYKDQDFTFVFDGEILKLLPDDISIVFSWTHEEIAKEVYVPHYPVSTVGSGTIKFL